jgi:hypothetical protein
MRFSGCTGGYVGQGTHYISKGLYFFLLKKKVKLSVRSRIFVHQRTVLAVKRVELVSDRIPYIVLIGNIIVSLNAHAPTEEKRDFSRDSF